MADTIDIARWYCVSRQGMATLCLDEADARNVVVECDGDWPLNAPHRAVLMGDVAAMRDERDRLRSELEAVKADAGRLEIAVDRLLRHCPDAECMTCGEAVCPHGEKRHFHHDGCPACAEVDAAIDAAMNDRKEG